MREFIILGTTLLGKVMADAIGISGDCVAGFLTEDSIPSNWAHKVLGKIEAAEDFAGENRCFILAEEDLKKREAMAKIPVRFGDGAVVHPSATVAASASLGAGVYVGAGAVIGPEVCVGDHTLIGEGSIVGAGSNIGSFCQLLSRVNLGRQVTVLEGSFMGASVTLKDKITIAAGSIIQTGEIVVKDMVMKMVYKRGAWVYNENGPGK